jgi:hypothetical protein
MHESMVRPNEGFGKEIGLVHEAIVTGRKAGADREFWAKLTHDEQLFRRVVVFVNGREPGTTEGASAQAGSYARALEIMGEQNVLGMEKVSEYYRVTFSSEQNSAFAHVQFTESALEACKDSHLLVAGFPLTIPEIRARAPRHTFSQKFSGDPRVFPMEERVGLGWFLLRKGILKDSADTFFSRQVRLLGPLEDLPRACELTYAVILYYLITGRKLFRAYGLRCADRVDVIERDRRDQDKVRPGHVVCGGFDTDGFRICTDLCDAQFMPSIAITGIRRLH